MPTKLLDNVLPLDAATGLGDGNLGDAVAFCQHRITLSYLSDMANVCFRQFGSSMLLPSLGRTSPFSPHVVEVVRDGSQKQVVRSDTNAVVAGVANKEIMRDWPMSERIGNTVSGNPLFGIGIEEFTVSTYESCPFPNPTRLLPFNFFPEALIRRFDGTSVRKIAAYVLPPLVHGAVTAPLMPQRAATLNDTCR